MAQGCTTSYATLRILAEDGETADPITGKVYDAASNRYLGRTPLTVNLEQKGHDPKPMPLLFKSPCGNLFYTMFVVDKWGREDDTYKKHNEFLFSIEPTKQCVNGD